MGGMTRLLLLLWAGVTVGSVVDLQKRIIGGHNCLNTERLYHVQLRKSFPDAFVCGGSLISDRWILTAAHCWKLTLYAVVGVHPGPGTRMDVRPHFFWDDQDRIHDIMLLKITKPTPTGITTITLPDCNRRITAGNVVQIAGHAATVTGLNNIRVPGESATLQCADTDVVDCVGLTTCLHNFPQFWLFYAYQHWFCGQRARVDISPGDSGGGVVYNGMIYGVISFMGDGTYACNRAAAFMDVCSYIDDISRITGIARPVGFVRRLCQGLLSCIS